jgi:hypothetical protein
MLVYNDLKPFVAGLTAAQSVIVIEDVEAELLRIAPTLTASSDPSVMRIVRAAGIRYAEYLKSGAKRLMIHETVRGPFTDVRRVAPTEKAVALDVFTAVEIQTLNAIADTTDPTPVVASPIGMFPLPDIYGPSQGNPNTDFIYAQSGGYGWLGQ